MLITLAETLALFWIWHNTLLPAWTIHKQYRRNTSKLVAVMTWYGYKATAAEGPMAIIHLNFRDRS
jgi:hypothetical protein